MLDTVSKNLWILLTVVMPGFFTYGLWRLCLFFVTEPPLSDAALKQIDASTLTTTSIIFAFAFMQQAGAIAIESLLYYFGKNKNRKSRFRILFCDRFELASENKLNERAERVVGNFFFSLNVSIGICLIIGYFYDYVGFKNSELVLKALFILLPLALITTYFRMIIAERIITECKNTQGKIILDQNKATDS